MKITYSVFAILALLFLFTILPAVAGEGDDEVEPNDTKALADTITGFVIRGHVDEDDPDDWFRLDGQEGTFPQFTIFFNDEEVEVDFEVYSDNDLVQVVQEYGSGESVKLNIPGECFIHVYLWSGEGDYRIEIEPEGGNCAGDSEIEPNDEKDLADLIEEDLQINGYACEGETDWFVLDGQEGYNPEITLIYNDKLCDIDLIVYSDDEEIGGLVGVESPDSDVFEIPGTCYIKVTAFSGSGTYTIIIKPAKS
ncbi:MAG TPA: hypothetical protein ENN67_04990 [Firmicutes bacterium]|nr:hypothetical protein [Bacillota bacterium]